MIKPRLSRVLRHQTKSILNYHYLGLWFVKTNSLTNMELMTFRLMNAPYNLSFEYNNRLLTVEIWIYIFTSLLIEFRKILEKGWIINLGLMGHFCHRGHHQAFSEVTRWGNFLISNSVNWWISLRNWDQTRFQPNIMKENFKILLPERFRI